MCGRATLTVPIEEIAEQLGAVLGPAVTEASPVRAPHYNLAPSQPMLIVRQTPEHTRELSVARWGLVPHWAKPDEWKKIASRCVQARVETAPRAPAFRHAFQSRRCLVVVDGFYEWKTLPSGERKPHHVRRADHKAFAIAGLWEKWRGADGAVVESCAVVTTEARGVVAELHDRMPLVVPSESYGAWLAGTPDEAAHVHATDRELVTVPVSKWVNDVRHDDPRCLEPDPGTPPGELGQVQLTFNSR